jgi:hypothetical protein
MNIFLKMLIIGSLGYLVIVLPFIFFAHTAFYVMLVAGLLFYACSNALGIAWSEETEDNWLVARREET